MNLHNIPKLDSQFEKVVYMTIRIGLDVTIAIAR